MVFSSQLTPEQNEASQVWVYKYYRSFDSLDVEPWIKAYHNPDIILHLGNFPAMKGFEEMQAHFDRQNPQLSSMRHDIKHIDVFSDRIYVQNEATFVVKNDPEQKEIKFPAICVLWKNVNEEKVSAIDVYFDPSALTERIQMFLPHNV